MLDLKHTSEHLDEVTRSLERRGFRDPVLMERLSSLAQERKAVITNVEKLRATRNEASQAMAKVNKGSPEFAEKREALRAVGDEIGALEAKHTGVERELEAVLLQLPNLPHESTPDGKNEVDNVVVRVWGEKPSIEGKARDHVDVATELGVVDFERAAKISGARFSILRGSGAKLERALIQFMLDLHTTHHGYSEVWAPVLIKDSALRGTGQLPKFASDVFRIAKLEGHPDTEGYDLYLSPTAEVQLTNLHADEILESAQLPVAYTAYTSCFRSEAGSYGKDTRGLIRQHQFDKVELVRLCRPEEGQAQLEVLTGHAEEVLRQLELHHRVIQLCTGDIGFASKKTYDLEVWLPGQDAYREISSCSWCGDFQARRANIRFRPAPKAKPEFVHTLNGSGLAVGRTLIAILEQYQQKDGSVRVPKRLVPYMGGVEAIRPSKL